MQLLDIVLNGSEETFLPFFPHFTAWNVDVMVGALAVIIDHDLGNGRPR